MKSIWLALIAAIIALMVAGCGGGGGGRIASSTASIRQIQPGDRVGYEITSEYAGEQALNDYQVYEYSASTETPIYGNRMLLLTVYSFRDHSGNDVIYEPDLTDLHNATASAAIDFEQAANGTIYMRGPKIEPDPMPAITGTPIWCPSPIAVNRTYSYTLTYSDRVYEVSGRVVALEAKDGYMAYKIHEKTSVSGNVIGGHYDYVTDSWFAPELGCMIRSESYQPEGQSSRTIMKMIDKSF